MNFIKKTFIAGAAMSSALILMTASVSAEPVKLKIFQGKVEFVEQLDKLARDFEKENPNVQVVIDTAGGGEDYTALLRTRMNSGNLPTIYNIHGKTALKEYENFRYDLTGQPWVKQALKGTLDSVTDKGKVYGQPYNIEGYGIIYNRKLLAKVGYTEEKLHAMKDFKDLEKLFELVDSKKKELGIEKVLSYSVGGTAWWTAAYHTFNIPFAMQANPEKFQADLNAGKTTIAGNPIFKGFVKTLDLFFKYSYDDLMVVSYDDQVANFAVGKTAFLHQGNWTINQLTELAPDLDAGFLPIMIPAAGAKNGSIPVGVPNYWAVNKKSPKAEIDAAVKFLNYIAMTARGHKFLVEEAKFIPAFKNVPSTSSDTLAKSILKFAGESRTIPWVWLGFPKGYNETDAKEAIQKYYQKKLTGEQFLKELDKKWAEKMDTK